MKNKCVVYVSSFPFDTERLDIFPVERKREIAGCKSEKSKAEKFYDWKLLEFAINDLFNKNISEVNLKKVGDKWLCDDFCFSLSHSENVVTVAVSNIGVGVDAEKVDDIRFSQLNVDRILTSKEKDKYLLLSDDARAQFLNIAWSKKESIFKKSNQKFFAPNKIETQDENLLVRLIESESEKYYITIASDAGEIDFKCMNGVSICDMEIVLEN